MFNLKNVYHAYSGQNWSDLYFNPDPVPGILVQDLAIAPEGVTAIIGPSGSGKTTLLSLLSGFISPAFGPGGDISCNGRSLAGKEPTFKSVAFVFQSPMLLGSGTAILNMLPGRNASRLNEEEMVRIATEVRELGLSGEDRHLLAKRSRDLSGGEKQRVAVLRALIADREAILCDEPTSSLDQRNAELAMGALRKWSQMRKRPVIWVTHNLDQAARYAQHHVFVSAGRIYRPTDAQLQVLQSEDLDRRLATMTEISRQLSSSVWDHSKGGGTRRILSSATTHKSRLPLWISQALSTDSLPAIRAERGAPGALLSSGHTALISKLDPDHKAPLTGLRRLWGQILSYNRYGLALIVFVLMTQIFAAAFGGAIAKRYSAERLRDPAVARIVFTHDVIELNSGRPEPTKLYDGEGSSILGLEQKIRSAVLEQTPDADPARVMIFGRRVINSSKLRFHDVPEACYRFISFDTVVLNRADPIFGETILAEEPGLALDLDEALARRTPDDAELPNVPRVLLDAIWIKRLRNQCGVPPDVPILADWQAGQAGQTKPLRVEVGAAVGRFPPLYPQLPELLVTENTYQEAANLFDEERPGPFRTAMAYFPIEGFNATRKVLEKEGYLPQDDSEKAVKTLRDIAIAAESLPIVVIIFNLAACYVVFTLVIRSLLELNKRVLALFVAHGFALWKTALVMVLHLLPAVLVGAGVLSVIVFWGRNMPMSMLPTEMEGLTAMSNQALVSTIALIFIAAVVIILWAVGRWWFRTRSQLNTYLQE